MAAERPAPPSAFPAIAVGMALGSVIGMAALGAAILSGGAGHGDYGAARLLFPASMLMTRVEGSIGILATAIALLQFPLYGALLGWSRARASWGALILVAALHVAGAILCFSGLLPNFS